MSVPIGNWSWRERWTYDDDVDRLPHEVDVTTPKNEVKADHKPKIIRYRHRK